MENTAEAQWAINFELAKKVASDALKKAVDRNAVTPGTYHIDEMIHLHIKGIVDVGKDVEKKGSVTAAILWKVLASLEDTAIETALEAVRANKLDEASGRDAMVKEVFTTALRESKTVKTTESRGSISGKGCMVSFETAEAVETNA